MVQKNDSAFLIVIVCYIEGSMWCNQLKPIIAVHQVFASTQIVSHPRQLSGWKRMLDPNHQLHIYYEMSHMEIENR